MKLIAHTKEALLNLSAAKLRSMLALLGVLVGTASVVAMVSGGQLATNEALKQFKVLGTDLLAVSINDPPHDDSSHHSGMNLTLPEALGLAHTDKHIQNVAPYTQLYDPIRYNGHVVTGGVLGVTAQFGRVVHVNVMKGRFISTFDQWSLFCVVGYQLYQQLKAISWVEPLGKQLQIGNHFFTIVGVAKPWPENNFVYASVDSAVLVPILASMTLSQYATINNLIVQLTPETDIELLKNHLTRAMTALLPNKQLYFRSAKELIASMSKQSRILTAFLGLIGSISLLVGGIGVMNIMLVSVIERKREIGIRLAVGATRGDIRALFLIEAVMLSLLGGFSGVIIGMIIAYVIAWLWHWEFVLFFLPPLIGFTVSVAVGIFFGFYPAYKASQLDPIAALRAE